MGDRILEVNGHNFNNITHAEAVMIMRNAWNLIILIERPSERENEGMYKLNLFTCLYDFPFCVFVVLVCVCALRTAQLMSVSIHFKLRTLYNLAASGI